MAIAMPKVDPMKWGIGALLLADLTIACFVVPIWRGDPMSELPPVARSAQDIRITGGSHDTATKEIASGRPPSGLMTWDPFMSPLAAPGAAVHAETVAAVTDELPEIPVGEIKIMGIINLNGVYLALVSTGSGPSEELRRGMMIPRSADIKVLEIRRDGILLGQPHSKNTFLSMARPELKAKPWYQSEDASLPVRGRIEMPR